MHEEGAPNIWGNAQIFSPYMRRSLVIYDFAPDPSKFPNIRGKFNFLFYQCIIIICHLNLYNYISTFTSTWGIILFLKPWIHTFPTSLFFTDCSLCPLSYHFALKSAWYSSMEDGVCVLRVFLPMWESCAGIFKQSMGARNRTGIGLSYRPARLHSQEELFPWKLFLGSVKV